MISWASITIEAIPKHHEDGLLKMIGSSIGAFDGSSRSIRLILLKTSQVALAVGFLLARPQQVRPCSWT